MKIVSTRNHIELNSKAEIGYQQSFQGGFRAITCKNPISSEEYAILKQKMAKAGGLDAYVDAQVSSVANWRREIKGVKKYMVGYTIGLIEKLGESKAVLREFRVSKRLSAETDLPTPFEVLSKYIDRLAKKHPSKEGEDVVVDFDFAKNFHPYRKTQK